MTFKVTLSVDDQTVIFEASVQLTEARIASYDDYSIIHLPTTLYAYRNTAGRNFGISGRLVSRNVKEAETNSYYVDLMRSWTLPDFGESGATPPIIKLSAYDNPNIQGIKCILRSYNVTWPDDVDWIYESSPPFPTLVSFSVDLNEAYTAEEITAKAWKILVSPVAAINDLGGVISVGGSAVGTPDISGLSSQPNFKGIASDTYANVQTVGNLITDPLKNIGNGSTTSTLGINNSADISENIINNNRLSNPLFSGGVSQNSISFDSPSGSGGNDLGGVITDSFGRYNTMVVDNPTEVA